MHAATRTGADDGGDNAPADTLRLIARWPRHDSQSCGPTDTRSARIQQLRVERCWPRRRGDIDIETKALDGEMRQRASRQVVASYPAERLLWGELAVVVWPVAETPPGSRFVCDAEAT